MCKLPPKTDRQAVRLAQGSARIRFVDVPDVASGSRSRNSRTRTDGAALGEATARIAAANTAEFITSAIAMPTRRKHVDVATEFVKHASAWRTNTF